MGESRDLRDWSNFLEGQEEGDDGATEKRELHHSLIAAISLM